MIVPDYWAEAKERIVVEDKARTYKRFGWSNSSQSDAEDSARRRLEEVLIQARAGKTLRLVDHKVPYNGAEGLPIREEVIERHGDAVISRNSYGALCLNTPDVLFADVDIVPYEYPILKFIIPTLLIVFIATQWNDFEPTSLIVLAVIVIGYFLKGKDQLIQRLNKNKPDLFETALESIYAFSSSNPEWLMRVYRTPNGYRVLVMHDLFDPAEDTAFDFMRAINSDKLYMQMCRNQKCFRARLTPKPWRIDMRHIVPRPGVWPISQERMADRTDWVEHYNEICHDYASCRYEHTLGQGKEINKCRELKLVHDSHCKVNQKLALA